ncbi:TPA: helix-turn-helix domain-containing protein [Bacillus pacificus]
MELADVVNVTRQTTSLIESNKFTPFIKICIHIAKTLDKSLDKLFWEEL